MAARPIIFHVDLSEESRRLIPAATDLALRESAKLFFVHVDTAALDEGALITGPISDSLNDLKTFEPSDSRVGFEHHVLRGQPGDSLVRFASRTKASMILLTSPQPRGILRRLLGGLHEYVHCNAPCPVMTLRPDLFAEQGMEAETANNLSLSVA